MKGKRKGVDLETESWTQSFIILDSDGKCVKTVSVRVNEFLLTYVNSGGDRLHD